MQLYESMSEVFQEEGMEKMVYGIRAVDGSCQYGNVSVNQAEVADLMQKMNDQQASSAQFWDILNDFATEKGLCI